MRWSVRRLCLNLGLACIAGLAAVTPTAAQVAGQNVNMVSGTKWPTGDPFLQRQNEPSMAVSTRNPLHILAGANDYRSVDLETVLSGGAETGDAWLGLFKSFDGGFTWQSNLLPGCPYAIGQCTDSGALGGRYQAAADPVVRAGTNGMFYFAGLAFDRATSANSASSVSTIFVARYNDLNNNEQIDPITYIDTHIVATGNSTQFLDKPSMAVDIPRAGASTCSFTANEPGVGPNGGTLAVHQSFAAGNIYLAYTDFLAGTKANSTPTHLMFTHSTDCGVTWSTPIQINTGTTTSQGSAIAVNPITGAVYVAWRQFASSGVSDAIMVAQSNNAGRSFSRPVQISTFQPFDQGTTGTSFRTNAYPAITTDFFGFVYVAFSARGVSSTGDARVVAAGSIDGTHWTPAFPVDNPSQNAQTNPSGRGHQIMPAITFANGRLTLLYYDLRLDHYAGSYTPNPASLGSYTEMLQPEGELAPPEAAPNTVFTPYIDDAGLTLRRHTLDLRVLELGIFPTVTLGPSVLVSQYEFGCCVNPEAPDIEQFKFNVPNLPLFDQGQEAFLGDYIDVVPSPMFVPNGNSWTYNFVPSVNPIFHATWTDNRDVVPPPPGGSWENYTAPVVAGALSVENGNPLPVCVPGQEGMRNQNIYTSQITGGLVAAAPGNAKPLGTTTFNGKTVPFQRAFPVEAQNSTGQSLNVRFTIANQPPGGTASFLQFSVLTTLDITIPPYSSVSRSVFLTSTNATATITVNVTQITAIGGSIVNNGLSSSATLNPDITNPNITNPNITNPNITNAEVTNPNITNPNITNPNITNPNITNPNITNTSFLNPNITNPNITNLNVTNVSATNPNITNPNITNPNITNPNITNPNITNPNITNQDIGDGSTQDVTYPITNGGNTTASYTVKTASNARVPGGIVLQLLVNKLYQTPVALNCQLGVQTHWVTVANITSPKLFTVADPNITNPDITNSSPNEASVTLAPGETAYITLRVVNPTPALTPFNPLTAITPVTVPQAVNTTTVLSNPGNPNLTPPAVFPPLAVLTTALPATDRLDAGYSVQLESSGGKPGATTWSVRAGTLPPGIALSASGLVSGQAATPGSYPVTMQVADSASPQNIATHNYTLNVSVTPLTLQFVLTPSDGVVGQAYVANPLAVNGGTTPYNWTAGGLPAGLSINASTGQISGSPSVANPGGSSVTVTATDAATPPESIPYTATIRIGSVISIGPATLPAGTIGAPYSAQLTATGGIGGFAFGPPSPAPGVLLSSSGLLTIQNPQTSSLTFSVSVHDSANPFQVQNANYTILFSGPTVGNVTFTTQPANSVGGQALGGTPVVHVADNSNAAVPGATVTMSLNGPPPCSASTLSGTLSVQTDAVGNATFSNLSVDHGQIGYTLRASVGNFSAVSNAFTINGFCPSSNLSTTRELDAQVLLASGKVLIAGGTDNNNALLSTAEIYDPATGTLSPTGNLSDPNGCGLMASVLLADGRVLLVGGENNNGNLSTAEIYDPASGSFAATGSMAQVRQNPTALLLADGRVLVTGGFNAGVALNTAEIYDPATGLFTATGTMSQARGRSTMTLLTNGKALVAGGRNANGSVFAALPSAEIFDPLANGGVGAFTSTGNMNSARDVATATLLSNGTVLLAGGFMGDSTGPAVSSADIFDPATGLFTPTGSLSAARGRHTATLLPDGTVLVAGGIGTFSGTVALATAEIYNPTTGTFSATGSMGAARELHRTTLLANGNALVTGGDDGVNALGTTEVYYSTAPLAPLVLTTPNPTALAAAPYTQFLLEQGGVGPLTWSLQSGTLPAGINFNSSNGLLSGTTANVGTFPLVITITDSSSPAKSVATNVTLAVLAPLAITTTTLPEAVTTSGFPGTAPHSPYSAEIQTTGGAGGALTFSVVSGALPPSISLNTSTGALSSSSVTDPAGAYNFTIQAASAGPPSATAPPQAFTLTVVPLLAGTTPNTLHPGTAGVAYSQNLTTIGGTPPITYQLTPGTTLPPGLAITTSSATVGLLGGTPTSAGSFTFGFQATDSSTPAQESLETVTLSIAPQPPTNVAPGPVSPGSISVIWEFSLSGGVTGYNVYRATTSGGPYSKVGSLPSTAFSFTDTTVGSGTTYYYVVRAAAGSVESVNSNEVAIQAP